MLTISGSCIRCLATLGVLVPIACSSSVTSPANQALERVEARAEAHATDDKFMLRLNPTQCDCPEFEVLLDETWSRVYLEPKDPEGPAEAARQALAASPGPGLPRTVQVVGRLSKSVRTSGNRTPCLVMKVFQVCGREGCLQAD